jgi:hypothetical protein
MIFCFCRSLFELWQEPHMAVQLQHAVMASVPETPINLLAAQVSEPLLPFISLPEYEGRATET